MTLLNWIKTRLAIIQDKKVIDFPETLEMIERKVQRTGGCSSVVEHFVANERVVGSNPITRSKKVSVKMMKE